MAFQYIGKTKIEFESFNHMFINFLHSPIIFHLFQGAMRNCCYTDTDTDTAI